jgi:hypothetical protein
VKPTRHVVFGSHAADRLREAFALGSVEASVACVRANYGVGPIDPPDPDLRRAWFATHIDGEDPADAEDDWPAALSTQHRLIAWTSRRDSREAAGFMEWLRRLDGRPCEIIDLTGPRGRNRNGRDRYLDLALMTLEEILGSGILETARPMGGSERDGFLAEWAGLRAANAPVRLATGGAMASAPITVFDDDLLAAAGPDWTAMSSVLGRVLGETYRRQLAQHVLGLLEARVRALVEAGRLEAQGEPREIAGCMLRVPRLTKKDT